MKLRLRKDKAWASPTAVIHAVSRQPQIILGSRLPMKRAPTIEELTTRLAQLTRGHGCGWKGAERHG